MYRPYLKMDSKVCNYTTLYWHIFVQYLSWRKNWIGSHSIQVFVFGKPYRTYRSKSFNIKWWHSQMFYSQNSVRKGGQSLDSFEPLRSMFVVYDNLCSKYLNQVIPPGTYRYPKATEWVNQVMPPETNPKLLISYLFGTIPRKYYRKLTGVYWILSLWIFWERHCKDFKNSMGSLERTFGHTGFRLKLKV